MRPLFAALVAALAISGCGGDSKTTKDGKTADAPALSTTTAEPSSTPVDECEAKGITTSVKKPGRCTDDNGVTHIVASRRSAVRLDGASVRYVSHVVVKSVDGGDIAPNVKAHGRFVIFRLKVKNTSNRPTGWSSAVGATALRLGGDIYSADSSTAAYSYAYDVEGDPGLEGSTDVQPGRSADAWVAFEIPAARVSELKDAELLVVSFSDSTNGYNAASESAQTQGTILL